MKTAALLALLTASAGALTLDESLVIERDHAAVADRVEARLIGLEALAGSKTLDDDALARWYRELKTVGADVKVMIEIEHLHRKALHEMDIGLLASALAEAGSRKAVRSSPYKDYRPLNDTGNAIDVRSQKLVLRYGAMQTAYEEAKAAHAQSVAHRTRQRWILGVATTAGALLATAALWASRRPPPRPPTSAEIIDLRKSR